MTRRDLAWRLGGLALFVAACGTGLINRTGTNGAPGEVLLGLMAFTLALTGVVLLIGGKRIPVSWRAELRRYRAEDTATRPRPRASDPAARCGVR